jgi:hypothetical protein
MSEQHDDGALTRALRAMAQDDQTLGASSEIEARLLAEAHMIASARRRRSYTAAGALAAALFAAIAIPAWRTATVHVPVRVPVIDSAGPAETPARPAPGEIATEFFPLMYSNVPVTNGQTIRIELPETALAAFGIEADDVSGTVLADVLVGQDGLARAVRFVRPVINKKEQR